MGGGYRQRALDLSSMLAQRSARFLQTAATLNAKMINYTNVANDAQVPRQTVRLWFQILVDTMLGYELPSYTTTVKRKSVETAKFYFFDTGIVRTLRRLPSILPESADFGEFFEQYIFIELRAWIDYRKLDSIEILPWREFLGRLWADEFSQRG